MELTFRKKNSDKEFSIEPGKEKGNFWLSRLDGEGGDFPVAEVENVIYEALDKYFVENH